MSHIYFAIAGLLLFAQCTKSAESAQGESAESARVAEQQAAPHELAATAIDSRTQHDLAAEIRLAERQSDEEARASQFATLAKSWQGHRYKWTAYYLSAFCPNEDGCHLVPFNRSGKDKDIVQGWSPQLKLSQEQWRALSGGCASVDGQCQVTFEATLSDFRISTEELTRLTFADVALVTIGSDVQPQ